MIKDLIHISSVYAIGLLFPEKNYPLHGNVKLIKNEKEYIGKVTIYRGDELLNCFDTGILSSICKTVKNDNEGVTLSLNNGEIEKYYDYVLSLCTLHENEKYEFIISGKCELCSDFSISINSNESNMMAKLKPVWDNGELYKITAKPIEGE